MTERKCPLCENLQVQLEDFANVRIFGLAPGEIPLLKEFYINSTGDTKMQKLISRSTEKGFQG